MDAIKCSVIEISRGTTHDGPGMRTTVFLKGCPLRCLWCQNPEGMKASQEVWWEARKCIRCLECIEACPQGALTEQEDGIHLDRETCDVCGECVDACPARARTFTGQEWTLEALLKEVLKDKDYYDAFGGGVTVSGGEPLIQYRFVAEFFRRLQAAGVHTALDTCGLAAREAFAAVLPYTDHVLYDIKFHDSALHQAYTGHTNDAILANLAVVADTLRERNATPGQRPMKLWIRTPLIPGATAVPENIAAIGQYINQQLADVVERWELCAFNPACRMKYQKLGLKWTYEDTPLMAQETIDTIRETALAPGLSVDKLVISGLIAR